MKCAEAGCPEEVRHPRKRCVPHADARAALCAITGCERKPPRGCRICRQHSKLVDRVGRSALCRTTGCPMQVRGRGLCGTCLDRVLARELFLERSWAAVRKTNPWAQNEVWTENADEAQERLY